ncbi:MAG: ACP S-malonyltransferase [Alphaproteobacteria bacterium]|nr:ACP S-malonyltransferase [Alphaproteobacteria bacterium]MBN2779828.1 ACP S-malonyltransferase [Alphaproteobacteria bacterium]
MNTLFMFPGQGSQKVGMGKDLYDTYPEAKAVFDEVDEALGEKLSNLIFNGPTEDLTLTANVQPALMTVSIAALRALEKETGKKITELANSVVGHSLGEYSALCAVDSLSLSDTAKLLRARGTFMQEAVPVGIGAIAAIIGLDMMIIGEICQEASTDSELVQIANDNCPGQTVISGHKGAVDRTCALATTAGARRALILPVSAPVHSALMQPAKEKMAELFEEITLNKPLLPLISNYSANQEEDPEKIKTHLLEQFTGRVRFTECISEAVNTGYDKAFEIGAGKVLCGLAGRITNGMTCSAITDVETIKAFEK